MPATLKDIAKETGLSTATISKYLNGAKLREKEPHCHRAGDT